MSDVPLTIVGAGVVGLAVAARLAPRFPGTILLERRARHGTETSSRNSEVIHAGLYYEPGSLKARLCVEGNAMLYELCARARLAHARCGKLVVATSPDEEPALETLCARAAANGAPASMLSAAEARALEPDVRATAALWSPSTGICSAHALMDCLLSQATSSGALLRPMAEIVGLAPDGDGYRLTARTPAGLETFTSARVVNAAGLEADTVAALAGIDVDAAGYRQLYCKGSYFAAAPRLASLVKRLVYPVPGPESLGIHAVVDVGGGLRFGPDVEYLETRALDHRVDPARRSAFGRAIRRYLPAVADEDLEPGTSGIRPKLQRPGEPPRDFVIAEESARVLPGLVNLAGIESPGLTAALAIAAHVDGLLL